MKKFWEDVVDGTGSWSCPKNGLDISSAELSGSSTLVVVACGTSVRMLVTLLQIKPVH